MHHIPVYLVHPSKNPPPAFPPHPRRSPPPPSAGKQSFPDLIFKICISGTGSAPLPPGARLSLSLNLLGFAPPGILERSDLVDGFAIRWEWAGLVCIRWRWDGLAVGVGEGGNRNRYLHPVRISASSPPRPDPVRQQACQRLSPRS